MRICLVGGSSPFEKNPGGAERQMHLLSKYFAESGHSVYHVIGNYAGPEKSSAGVRYPVSWKHGEGLPFIRFFLNNIANLRKTIQSINPDAVYTRGFSVFAPFVGSMAGKQKKVSVAGLAHDRDIDYTLANAMRTKRTVFTSMIFRITFSRFQKHLDRCSLVIAQTKDQNKVLGCRGIESMVVGNIVAPATDDLIKTDEKRDVIWVASIYQKKCPEKLLDIVAMMPETTFTIVGRLGDDELRPILDQLMARNNVKYLGHLEHHETQMEMAKHRIVINTSLAEGFSNVFLEAWSLAKPVVSLNVNPDNLLSGSDGLGCSMAGDIEGMVETIARLLGDDDCRQRIGNRGRHYIAEHHSPRNASKLIELISSRMNHV